MTSGRMATSQPFSSRSLIQRSTKTAAFATLPRIHACPLGAAMSPNGGFMSTRPPDFVSASGRKPSATRIPGKRFGSDAGSTSPPARTLASKAIRSRAASTNSGTMSKPRSREPQSRSVAVASRRTGRPYAAANRRSPAPHAGSVTVSGQMGNAARARLVRAAGVKNAPSSRRRARGTVALRRVASAPSRRGAVRARSRRFSRRSARSSSVVGRYPGRLEPDGLVIAWILQCAAPPRRSSARPETIQNGRSVWQMTA